MGGYYEVWEYLIQSASHWVANNFAIESGIREKRNKGGVREEKGEGVFACRIPIESRPRVANCSVQREGMQLCNC